MTSRSYRSTVRERAAAATRTAILDTAEALFAEHGYARVTIKRIAEAADVAQGTVYGAFGSKPALVTALTERAADDAGIGEVLVAIRSVTTGDEVVRQVVRSIHDLVRHHRHTMIALFDAATVDQGVAALLDRIRQLERERFAQVTGRLEQLGALRPGVTASDAVRVLEYFVTPPSWFRMLEIGWDWEEACVFLEDAVCSALLLKCDRIQ
ncbi:TetR/AcrR family transcriptional regulator [Streptomyces sp. NPDC001068]|uniref:TetR/AcrR family transcriptional regulator n=1 Tax=Streptomyces sp. NPDC001068 TaxID=3364544 RepID=UPI00367655FB